MLAFQRAGTKMKGRTEDFFHSQQIESSHGPHDINYGVHGPDLMKMDSLYGALMHLGLGPGQPGEDFETSFLHRLLQVTFFKNFFNVVEMPVVMMVGFLNKDQCLAPR